MVIERQLCCRVPKMPVRPDNPTMMTRDRAVAIIEEELMKTCWDNPVVMRAWRIVRDQPWLPIDWQDADEGRRQLTNSE